jgi:putative transcriptional regulator
MLDNASPRASGCAADPMDALLASYSAGALPPPVHVLVASHLALKGENRSFVAALDAVAARERIDRIAPQPLADRDAALAAAFAADEADATEHAANGRAEDPLLPPPLRRYLGRGLDAMPWRRRLPGVRACTFERFDRGEAGFLWVKPGRRMPSHTHEGSEITLVLKGAFRDGAARYGRGDVAIADSEVDHHPQVEPGDDCLCFVVTDAPLHLTGPVGRILERLFRG